MGRERDREPGEWLPFGEVLKAFRTQKGISQRDLAARLGVHRNTVGNWERGNVLPESRAMVLELANRLGLYEHETLRLLQASLTDIAAAVIEHPLYWNVPYQRNHYFTGRDDLLKQLHTRLRQEHAAALTQSFALSGLGGIGKTQTAVEYAYRHIQEYSALFWISAETTESILLSFASLADYLGLPEKDEPDQRKLVTAVSRWLTSHQDWLLIVDNVEDLELVKRMLPATHQGAYLFTTRLQSLGTFSHLLPVERMTVEEGAELLLTRARRLTPGGKIDQVEPADRALARMIVETLDGLPLGIDQAGAYLEETSCSLADYLQFYQRAPLALLGERGTGPDHPASVSKTFGLAFEKIEQRHPAAADLLRVCAFLSPDAIPEALLTGGASYLGAQLQALVADPLQYNTALKELLSYSLIGRHAQAKMLNMHRLLQVVLKEQMANEEQQDWRRRILLAVEQAFPADRLLKMTMEQWTWCEQLLPHALICASWREQWDDTSVEMAVLLMKTGSYLQDRARYEEAEPLLQSALAMCERVLGPAHPDTAQSLNSLGVLYRDQGSYTRAEPLLQRALAIREEVLGPAHPDTAQSLHDLGLLYRDQGSYARAESLLQRALAIREEILGPAHLDTAQNLNSLGVLYGHQGRYAEAEPLLQRALAIREQVLGPAHPGIAPSLNNLSNVYEGQGKYTEAEPLYQRALAIREQAFGPTHPETAQSLNNLGVLYLDRENYTEAEPLLQRALTIREQALGPGHPETSVSLLNLGEVRLRQGRYAESEPLLQRALAIQEQELSPVHPYKAYSLNDLGVLYREQARYAEAEPFLQRALAIREQVLGHEHPHTAECLHELGMLYASMGRDTEAKPLLQRALAIVEQSLGLEHPLRQKIMRNMALLEG